MVIGVALVVADVIKQKDDQPPEEEAIHRAKVFFAIAVPLIALEILLTVVGFIGICRPHLRSLQVFAVILFICTPLSFFSDISGSFGYGLSRNIAALVMVYFIIREVKRANKMD